MMQDVFAITVLVKNHPIGWFFVDNLASNLYNSSVMTESRTGFPQEEHGQAFEPTSPFAMERLIREAVRSTSGQPDGNVVFPYVKGFYRMPYYLNMRRRTGYLGEDRFSLDIGPFSDKGERLYSEGFADFRVADRAKERPQIGILCLGEPVFVASKPFSVVRSYEMVRRFEGIHVLSDLRGNGLGRGLVSAARVILDELGVRVLLIDQIKTGTDQGGEFYRRLGGRHFETAISDAMCMPAYQTPRLPYFFS